MADRLRVFAYDVASDRRRARVAAVLEEAAVRVQESVFEARMNDRQMAALVARVRVELLPDDSFRAYTVETRNRHRCVAIGGPPVAEAQDFWLL